MRRYNYDDDLDYSHRDSVDDYDMRSYATSNGYHNTDYDERNWWQPELEENRYEENYDNYDIPEPRRRRHLRPLGIRRSVDNNRRTQRNTDYNRRNYHDSSSLRYNNDERQGRNDNGENRASRLGMSRSAYRREFDYQNEGYAGRNADDYSNDYYESGYYYKPGKLDTSDVRNDNEYVYKDYSDDDGTRRRKRWSEDYDYYGSFPSYRRSDEDDLELRGNERSWGRNRRRERMSREDEERGRFSDRRHDFGYYADDRYDDYPRRRPNIRDSVY